MIKVIIFDLDNTLIDTNALEPLRASKNWREIPKLLSHCSVHKDVLGLLNTARSAGIKIAIFTDAPSNYVQKLLKYFDISVDFIVAYHNVKNHKPDDEGVKKILTHFGLSNEDAIYIGDSDLDKNAASNAGVKFITVEWGTISDADQKHIGVSKLSEIIGARLGPDSAIMSELQRSGNQLYLGYYLEGIKQEVWAFKNGVDAAIKRWSDKAAGVAEHFPDIDVVVRALGHSELKVTDSNSQPLDKLARNLANGLSASYKPDLIVKNRKLLKSTNISAIERQTQVHGAYAAIYNKSLTPKNQKLTFLIVDDVYTSGATANEISRAIAETYPSASIYIFTLVKTLFRAEANKASSEMQLNTLLFANLYSSTNITPKQEKTRPRKNSENLVTKKFSANYARTNHNFIIQNLKPYSIASEANLYSIFSVVQIIKNILQRGKPTIASRRLRNAVGLDLSESGINTSALGLISSRVSVWSRLIRGHERTDHYPAKDFFDELLPKHLGDYKFVKQLTVPEVQIFDMTQVYVDHLHNKQVDFFIPQVGLIIEIDGIQHQQTKSDDAIRDAFTEKLGLETIRFTTQEVKSENSGFLEKMERVRSYIERIDNLERDGTLNPPNGITLRDYKAQYEQGVDCTDFRVRLTAAIRFQILLLELLERGMLHLGKSKKIVLINRDKIDFAWDALEDLNEFISNLLQLQGITEGVLDLEIEELNEIPVKRSGSDLIIDFSILERYDDSFQVNRDVIYSRTHYLDFYHYFPDQDSISLETGTLIDHDFFQMSCTKPIAYNLDLSPDSKQRESLKYFLCNLFLPFLDKADFREGQAGIISSALSCHGTIGLLPTGSGKSICYQIAASLQPAISFVVCPIKSLMYDQKTDLDSIGFTRSNYISSDLTASEKTKVHHDFGRGRYFFIFISPERLQTKGFRKQLSGIGLDFSFSYAIIDEVHCLSEWGHDFRTSYLNLANTIARFAPDANYIGLTATASVNVLKDIQSEFDIPDNYVRTPLDFTRKELAFHAICDEGNKNKLVVNLVSKMDRKWNGSEEQTPKAGIIFTPTVNGKNGCHSLAGRLSKALDMDVRFFSGKAPNMSGYSSGSFKAYKQEAQSDFKSNKYRLLTATKAFGMGVNKKNIAYTIHFGIPGSMEALYQEAGRAGRDKKLFKKKPADCYVLLTKEPESDLLDKIWDPSTSIPDLKKCVSKLTKYSDINTNMFLMASGLDTIDDEFNSLNEIYDHLQSLDGINSIILTAQYFKSEKNKFEKSIYRLSQLGIVSDWTVDDFMKGVLHVEFEILSDEKIEHNIENTIRRYEPGFSLGDIYSNETHYYKDICDNLHNGNINKTQFIFHVLLLWSYDHFVYNRRQSLKTVYEQCSDLASGRIGEADFKDRLEGYFKFNDSSHALLYLIENPSEIDLWLSVFFENANQYSEKHIINESPLLALKEQISRFLESYKDNVFLNYISGIVRLASDQFDDADGKRRMSSSLDRLMNENKESALNLVRKTLQLKPIFSKNSQSQFARFIHEKFDDLSILKEVNEEFGDAYSYRKLLAPLVLQLDRITNKQKGIDW